MKRLHPFKSLSVPQQKKHRSDSGSLQRWSGKVQIDTITVLLKTQGARIFHLLKRRMGFCTVTTLFNGIFQDWHLHSHPAIDGYNRTPSDIWVIFFLLFNLWQRFEGNWVVVLDFHMEGVHCVPKVELFHCAPSPIKTYVAIFVFSKTTLCVGCGGWDAFCEAKDGSKERTVSNPESGFDRITDKSKKSLLFTDTSTFTPAYWTTWMQLEEPHDTCLNIYFFLVEYTFKYHQIWLV